MKCASKVLPGNGHDDGPEGGEVLSVPHGRLQPARPRNVHVVPQALQRIQDGDMPRKFDVVFIMK